MRNILHTYFGNQERMEMLCKSHHVDKLYLFGSAVKGELKKDSDIDFLVKFKPFNLENYLTNFLDFKSNLESIFNRRVDLVEEQTLKNPILIKSIHQNRKLIYG